MVYVLLASGYGDEYEPAGGWGMVTDDDDRAVVVAGEEVFIRDIPRHLAEAPWAAPFLNVWRLHRKHGYPEGPAVGWGQWPQWYFDLVSMLDALEAQLDRGA
jgi:hypothetical protein